MSLKDTNATLFNMLTDLEEEKRSSFSEDSENIEHSASLENTQMADEKTSHLTVVNPLDNLFDAKATVVLGNTKTVLANPADYEEDTAQNALEEDSISKKNIVEQFDDDQKEENLIQENNSFESMSDKESFNLLSEETHIDEREDSNILSLKNKKQQENITTSSILNENENKNKDELDLSQLTSSSEDTASLTLSKFMEHAESSVSQSQGSLDTPLDSSLEVSPSALSEPPMSSSSDISSELSSKLSIDPLPNSSSELSLDLPIELSSNLLSDSSSNMPSEPSLKPSAAPSPDSSIEQLSSNLLSDSSSNMPSEPSLKSSAVPSPDSSIELSSNLLSDSSSNMSSEPSLKSSAVPSPDSSIELSSNLLFDSFDPPSSKKHSEIPSIASSVASHDSMDSPEPVKESTTSKEDRSFSAGVILKHAGQLKIAQERIHELEDTVFAVRQENAGLSSEIETLKKRIEELSSLLDSSERRNRTKVESISDERGLLEESLFQKNREYNNLKLKIEELKNRLAKDLKSVRVREIELENRLELVKQEKTTLLKSKDEVILNLKRKTEHLIMDMDGYRKKAQVTQVQISENEERIQRSVRALRLALGMLEGSDS